MREKFVRSNEHINVNDVMLNHDTEQTKKNLERLKTAVENMKKTVDGSEFVKFEELKMAPSQDCSDITIDNAHILYGSNISSEKSEHFDPISDSLFRRK